jgi:hypothetical protein
MRALFADAGSRAGKPSGTKGFFINKFDNSVMRRILCEVEIVMLCHEIGTGQETEKDNRKQRTLSRSDHVIFSVVAGLFVSSLCPYSVGLRSRKILACQYQNALFIRSPLVHL